MRAWLAVVFAVLLALPLSLVAGHDAPLPECCQAIGSDCHGDRSGPALACCGPEAPPPAGVSTSLVRVTGDPRPLHPLLATATWQLDAAASAAVRTITVRHRQHASSAPVVATSVLRI